MELDVLEACSADPLSRLQKDTFSHVMDEYLSCVMEEGAERQRLASRATAIVHHQLAWPGIHPLPHQLASLILNFELPSLEALESLN